MLSEKPWRGEAVLQFCLGQCFCLFLGLSVMGLVQQFGSDKSQNTDAFVNLLLGTLSVHGAALVLIGFFLRQHGVGWAEAFGFRKAGLPRALFVAVVVACAVLPIALLLQQASAGVLLQLGWEPKEQAAVTVVRTTQLWWKRAYLAAFTIGLAPVAEEFVFRGMLYPVIKRVGYPWLAWFGVSFAFALVHGNAAGFASFFVLALALTWLYEHTDNLLAPITVHALFNAANFVLLLWQDQASQ